VFGPGYHKGTLYTPEMCRRVGANFARLRGHLTPAAKLGHDRSQRLSRSLGLPNVGRVVAVRVSPAGVISLDLAGVPVNVGGEIAAGRINAGSIELVPKAPDPTDPAKEIDGPVLTGVALLGEEQPALKGFPPPVATYPDGTPVPPAADAAPWLEAMAEVMSAAAAFSDAAPTVTLFGRELPVAVVCFADLTPETPPVDKDQIIAALMALPPDQQAEVLAAVPPAAPPAAPPPAAPPDGQMSEKPKWFADYEAKCDQKFAEMDKRQGAAEKFAEDAQKEKGETEEALMSELADQHFAKVTRKVTPFALDKVHRPAVKSIITGKTFSTAADKRAAIGDYFAPLLALPDDPSLAAAPGNPVPAGPAALTTQGRAVLDALKVTNPRVAAKYATA